MNLNVQLRADPMPKMVRKHFIDFLNFTRTAISGFSGESKDRHWNHYIFVLRRKQFLISISFAIYRSEKRYTKWLSNLSSRRPRIRLPKRKGEADLMKGPSMARGRYSSSVCGLVFMEKTFLRMEETRINQMVVPRALAVMGKDINNASDHGNGISNKEDDDGND